MAHTWWQVVDGVARPIPDAPAVSEAIDNGTLRNVYGSIEGAIIHGGILATAFKRKTEPTFDAMSWLTTGELVPAGEITVTTITAQPHNLKGTTNEL